MKLSSLVILVVLVLGCLAAMIEVVHSTPAASVTQKAKAAPSTGKK